MHRLLIKNLGPIHTADISFAGLTLFVGPQASGKSIVLQLVKLIEDRKHIRRTLEQYGYTWPNDAASIFNRYFGEGMAGIWGAHTGIIYDGRAVTKSFAKPAQGGQYKDAEETVFYVPAQRVVCLQNGWPRYFSDYDDAAPYVLRHFSELLRKEMEDNNGSGAVFPAAQRLSAPVRRSFNESIFHDGKIAVDRGAKKRLTLQTGGSILPFIAWSAGQKEFMPLLMSFYYLCPPSKSSMKDAYRLVILEEPEMGLHPQAIQSVILQVLVLISRGYKVVISTHSPVLLEFAWAYRYLRSEGAGAQEWYKLFGIKADPTLKKLFEAQLDSLAINTYYFDHMPNGVAVKDISALDAGDEDYAVADWGGLSSFIGRATEIVAGLVNKNDA